MRKWKSKMPRGFGDVAKFVLFIAVSALFSLAIGNSAMFLIERITKVLG